MTTTQPPERARAIKECASLKSFPQEGPDFTNIASLVAWIERVRTVAFLQGARHDEITKAEVRELQRHLAAFREEGVREAVEAAARIAAMTSPAIATAILATLSPPKETDPPQK